MQTRYSGNESTLSKINKKLNVLKERYVIFSSLQEKIDKVEKTVEKILHEPTENEIVKNRCGKCDFVAKNEQGMKIHLKSKHTEGNRIKCWRCDFTCETKTDFTEHNDKYYYSHRLGYYPHRKKDYLEEFEELKSDGFIVKEDFYNEVLKWNG